MHRSAASLLTALAVLGVACFWFIPPLAQPQWYHDFADKRTLLGVTNFWNVISNLPFLFVGGWGIWWIVSGRAPEAFNGQSERWMYLCLFAAIGLTGVGSSYYHLEPNNERLAWDRLPIAVSFMAFFAIIISEHVDRQWGRWFFWPLVLLGAGGVVYWHFSEAWGRGDLRPYFLTQSYPVVAIPIILWFCPGRYTKTENLYSAMGWYAGAKFYEFLDKEVYSFGQIISGHTLKHIGAAVSCYMVLNWVRQRRLVGRPFPKAYEPPSH